MTHKNRRIGETDEQVAMRWINGETLQDIGNDHGVTREAVRLRVKKYLVSVGVSPEAVKVAHREDREKMRWLCQQEADYRELLRRMAAERRCAICPCFVLRSEGFVTCSDACSALMRTSVRYWTSDERREMHRRQLARSILRRPENYRPSSVAWAQRMLSDNPPPPNRRYVAAKNRELAAALGAPVGRQQEAP